MAAYELLLLNTAVPQIQAAQAGDTYVVPRDIAFSAVANLANGTYLLPALAFSSDPDTGIFRQGANQLGFTAGGGTDQMVLTSTGLGIGTSSPGYPLEVRKDQNAGTKLGVQNQNSGASALAGIDFQAYGGGWQIEVPASTTFVNPLRFSFNASEKMRLDSSGNLGIGTTSPGSILEIKRDTSSGAASSYPNIRLDNGNASGYTGLYFLDDAVQKAGIEVKNDIGAMQFFTGMGERARITSGGDFYVSGSGVDTGIGAFLYTDGYCRFNTAGTVLAQFRYSGSAVGSISTDGVNTAYNTSSDYRLKDNPQPLTGSGAFIDALKPKTWDWKSGGKGVGFIAHEVAEVSPGTVVGGKDAVDADGNPIMQAMEYGSAEFIANIIAELQSLRARVAQLEGN